MWERVIFMNAAARRRALLSRACLCEKGQGRLRLGMRRAGPWCGSAAGEAVGWSCELDKVKVPVHKATARAQA